MKNRSFEKKINNSIFKKAPDVLPEILEKCGEKRGFSMNENNEKVISIKKSYSYFPRVAIACALVVVIGAMSLVVTNFANVSGKTIISIDVNPSIELCVDNNDTVIDSTAVNDDGEEILEDVEIENVDVDTAIDQVIDEMVEEGYLTPEQNSVLISVNNKNEKRGKELKDKISQKVDKFLSKKGIKASIISQQVVEENNEELAEKCKISKGKARFISKIIDAGITDTEGKTYNAEELAKLKINDLNLIFKSREFEVGDVEENDTLPCENNYIGKGNAKKIAYEAAGVSQKDVKKTLIYFDCNTEKDTFVYHIRFESNSTVYEYVIDAKSGEILESEAKAVETKSTTTAKVEAPESSTEARDVSTTRLAANNKHNKNNGKKESATKCSTKVQATKVTNAVKPTKTTKIQNIVKPSKQQNITKPTMVQDVTKPTKTNNIKPTKNTYCKTSCTVTVTATANPKPNKKNDFNQSDKGQNGKQNNYFKDIQPTIAVTPVNQFAK